MTEPYHHPCPAARCMRLVSMTKLMCRQHWFMVPKPLRDDERNAWAGGMGAGSSAHRNAIMAAIAVVNEKLRQTGLDD
jgi:hypothetical protein